MHLSLCGWPRVCGLTSHSSDFYSNFLVALSTNLSPSLRFNTCNLDTPSPSATDFAMNIAGLNFSWRFASLDMTQSCVLPYNKTLMQCSTKRSVCLLTYIMIRAPYTVGADMSLPIHLVLCLFAASHSRIVRSRLMFLYLLHLSERVSWQVILAAVPLCRLQKRVGVQNNELPSRVQLQRLEFLPADPLVPQSLISRPWLGAVF